MINFMEKVSAISYVPIRKESEFYLHKRQLLNVWMNDPSPLPFFHSVYESRMKNIHDKHPMAESELAFHDSRLEVLQSNLQKDLPTPQSSWIFGSKRREVQMLSLCLSKKDFKHLNNF